MTVKELFDMEHDPFEKADFLRVLKEFRDFSLSVPQQASVKAFIVVGDWDFKRRSVSEVSACGCGLRI